MRVATVLMCLLASASTTARAQHLDRSASERVAIAPEFTPTPSLTESRHLAPVAVESGLPRSSQGSPPSGNVVGGAVLASAGSMAGAVAGAFAGMFVAAVGGATEEFSGLVPGVVLGSWFGAATGSLAGGGDFSDSLLGSAVGLTLAVGLAAASGEASEGKAVLFSLTHGVTTALFGF